MKTHSHWFDLHIYSVGMIGFMLHRLTGIGLVVYLYLHLYALDELRQGSQAWDKFLQMMSSPLVLLLDSVLLFGVLFHGLNGLRLVLVGLGLGFRWQGWLFWSCLCVSIILTIFGILVMILKYHGIVAGF